MLSQKCQYGLRALFDLAKHYGEGPRKTSDIAEAQAIPPRFLEVILGQLRQGGFVESRRGSEGGYFLARTPASLAVGEVIRFIEGPLGPVGCRSENAESSCRLRGNCVFLPMWERVRQAVSRIYDETSFQDLVEEEVRLSTSFTPSYAI